ncbi:hypothetical protein D5086_023250 [Populus alba]|uniref:Uncharacterized protein n=1 Tax=Populus alba TaxID=43335 RepID=A0ACC4B9P7_POPAL
MRLAISLSPLVDEVFLLSCFPVPWVAGTPPILRGFSAWLSWLPIVLIGLSVLEFSLWVIGSVSFCPVAVADSSLSA